MGLLVFPKGSGKKAVKKGDTARSELQNVAQNTLKEIIPVPKPTLRVKARAITKDEKAASAYRKMRKARTAAHYVGQRKVKADAKKDPKKEWHRGSRKSRRRCSWPGNRERS